MLQSSILSQTDQFTDDEVRAFNTEYDRSFRRARKLADRNLRRMTSGKARSQHLCWDILKRLRPSPGTFLFLRSFHSFNCFNSIRKVSFLT